jgi:DNA modification methylase
MSFEIIKGDCLDLIQREKRELDLVVTDPPYAFGGSGDEHAISATVAVVLREAAQKLKRGRWMIVMCASSYRSMSYMVESVRGVVEPVRIIAWCKPGSCRPQVRSKMSTPGWKFASVLAIAFRKGKADVKEASEMLDHVTAAPVRNGRRAELPASVALWAVKPWIISGGLFLDPFAGSGALVKAAASFGMTAIGYERKI